MVFEPGNVELLIVILKAILSYNMEANVQCEQLMLLFFEPLIKRVCAASKI